MTERAKDRYVCTRCGALASKYTGQCKRCGAWNTAITIARARREGVPLPLELAADDGEPSRMSSGFAAFDLVLGGGIVEGSSVLVASPPGIGKSTLFLGTGCHIAATGATVMYVHAEEDVSMIRQRAKRLQLTLKRTLYPVDPDTLEGLAAFIERIAPKVVIIDSLQEFAGKCEEQAVHVIRWLNNIAHECRISILIVSHINAKGGVTGPTRVKHAPDAVFMLEGSPKATPRKLVPQKNRFGRTDVIGHLEMTDTGMVDASGEPDSDSVNSTTDEQPSASHPRRNDGQRRKRGDAPRPHPRASRRNRVSLSAKPPKLRE